MIKNKVLTSIMVASATLGLALVLPTFTGSNHTVTASAATYNGKTYKTLDEAIAAANADDTPSAKKEIAKETKAQAANEAIAAKKVYGSVNKGTSAAAKKAADAATKKTTKKKTAKKTTKKKAAKKYAYRVSKLTSKKTKSNKYVKVRGTIKVSTKSLAAKHHAKWARITTYKGYKYVRLSKKGTFKKTIKAPKAKHTWAKAGYYTKKVKNGKVVKKHGKIVYTFHLLSASKKVSVKAYK